VQEKQPADVVNAPETDHVDLVRRQWAHERPDLDTGPTGIIARIGRAQAYIDPALDAVFAEHALTRASWDVLAALRRTGKPYRLTPTELYQALITRMRPSSDRNYGAPGRLDDPDLSGLIGGHGRAVGERLRREQPLTDKQLRRGAVVDRLDPLREPAEVAVAGGLVTAVRAQHPEAEFAELGFDLPAGQARFGQHGRTPGRADRSPRRWSAGPGTPRVRRAWDRPDTTRSASRPGRPAGRAESPVVARVRGAIAVAGPAGQLGALHRLSGCRTRHRGDVDQAQRVAPRRRHPGPVGDRLGQQRRGRRQPLVLVGLLGQEAEQMPEPAVRHPQEAVLVTAPAPPRGSTSSASVSPGRRPRSIRGGTTWSSIST
jgi:hypothetical protein